MQLRVRQFGVTLLVAAGVGLPGSAFAAMASGAAVTGVVRDVQGVAQAGALVQVMTAGFDAPKTAFTDGHGRYSIVDLLPGKYAVQASAALFISSTKDNLQLRAGKWAVANLTLATLFDTAAWLPAERRRVDEPEDDWKWTLRSSANRPMLRMVDDTTDATSSSSNDSGVLMSSSATSGGSDTRYERPQARAGLSGGDGDFGRGGTHNIFSESREMADGSVMALRMDIGMPTLPIGVAPSSEIDLGVGRQLGYAGAVRSVVSYQNHPEIINAGGGQDVGLGMASMQMASAEQMQLGDSIKVEVGSELYAVRTIRTIAGAAPFISLMVEPNGDWTIGYRMATSRDLQGFADLDSLRRELPVAVTQGSRVRAEHGLHQEISVSRKVGHGLAQVALYHDGLDHPAVGGGGLLSAADGIASNGIVEDPSTSSFRMLGPAYTSNGMNIMISQPLSAGIWAAVEYSTGNALTGHDVADGMSLADATAALHSISAQCATFAVKGRLIRSGTKLRAAYRWQPTGLVTAVDSYRAFSDQAYLSVSARQPIRIGRLLPPGLEGSVSVTNLLAQGYKPFLSSDGSTLFLAQSPRSLEAGLSVTF